LFLAIIGGGGPVNLVLLDVQIQEGTVPQLREHMMLAKDGQILPHIQQEESDMAAYIIGLRRSEPRGTAWREEYLPKTAALMAKHGGKVLIGGNSPRALMALEGEAKLPLSVVILEFPSLEHAQAFHNDPDYAPLKQLRQANIDMEVFVVEQV
jgi:uncharacterized protein (DUF1330 family)